MLGLRPAFPTPSRPRALAHPPIATAAAPIPADLRKSRLLNLACMTIRPPFTMHRPSVVAPIRRRIERSTPTRAREPPCPRPESSVTGFPRRFKSSVQDMHRLEDDARSADATSVANVQSGLARRRSHAILSAEAAWPATGRLRRAWARIRRGAPGRAALRWCGADRAGSGKIMGPTGLRPQARGVSIPRTSSAHRSTELLHLRSFCASEIGRHWIYRKF